MELKPEFGLGVQTIGSSSWQSPLASQLKDPGREVN